MLHSFQFSPLKLCLHTRDKVFNNEPSEICGRQPLKNLNTPFVQTLKHVKASGVPMFSGGIKREHQPEIS